MTTCVTLWRHMTGAAMEARPARHMQQDVSSHGGRAGAARALMSFFRLRLKQQYRILRWPVFRPSTMHGMERSRSLREYRISSCRAAARSLGPQC